MFTHIIWFYSEKILNLSHYFDCFIFVSFFERHVVNFNTIPEYFIKEFLVCATSYCYIRTMCTSATFFMNCRLLFGAGCAHFKLFLAEMDELASQRDQQNIQKIKICSVDAIKLHMELLR